MRVVTVRSPVALRRDAGGYRLSVFRRLSRSIGGVQENGFCIEEKTEAISYLKQGQIALLQDGNRKHSVETLKHSVPDGNDIAKSGK